MRKRTTRTDRRFCAQCGAALAAPCPKCGVRTTRRTQISAASVARALVGEPQRFSHFDATAEPTAVRVTPEQTDASTRTEGERKTVTALFADIKGSMELMEDLDPEEARAIVDPALQADDGRGPSLRRLHRAVHRRRHLRAVRGAGRA